MVSESPEKPRGLPQRKVRPLIILVWVLMVGIFVVGSGCTLMFFGLVVDDRIRAEVVLGLVIMIAGLVLFIYGLRQAGAADKAGEKLSKIWLFLLGVPILAIFIWSGGCILGLNI